MANKVIITELSKRIVLELKYMKKYNTPMDVASWGYEEGIVITGNDGQAILDLIKENKELKKQLNNAKPNRT